MKEPNKMHLSDLSDQDGIIFQVSMRRLTHIKRMLWVYAVLIVATYLVSVFIENPVVIRACMIASTSFAFSFGSSMAMRKVHMRNIWDSTKPWHDEFVKRNLS